MVMGISIAVAITGILVSILFYIWKPDIPKTLGAKYKAMYTTLWNKYYVDELYDFIVVRPVKWTASHLFVGVTDAKIIEGIVNGIPRGIATFGEKIRKIQTGHLQHYAISMAIGLFVILTLVLIAAGK
jgi:NADH-quinone oxidoreductase subunit L